VLDTHITICHTPHIGTGCFEDKLKRECDMRKVTLATIKSFIRKNKGEIFIRKQSRFDGMSDMVERNSDAEFRLAGEGSMLSHDLGISGAWFVGSSRDSFERISEGNFEGFNVYNCCGEFDIAIKA